MPQDTTRWRQERKRDLEALKRFLGYLRDGELRIKVVTLEYCVKELQLPEKEAWALLLEEEAGEEAGEEAAAIPTT